MATSLSSAHHHLTAGRRRCRSSNNCATNPTQSSATPLPPPPHLHRSSPSRHASLPLLRPPLLLLLALCALLLLLLPPPCAARIVQVQVIHRHGARPPLRKHSFDPSDEAPQARPSGALYDEGEKQMEDLGQHVRSAYFDAAKGGKALSASEVQSYSSNLPRTLQSARAFLRGVLPPGGGRAAEAAAVGTMVFNATRTDWHLRGYALCPRLGAKFAEFAQSKEFAQRRRHEDGFLKRITKDVRSSDTKLDFESVFNLHDRFAIVYAGYDPTPETGGNWPKLAEADMERLEGLADWYESRKFHYGTHGGLPVAAGLLDNIVKYARAFESSPSAGGGNAPKQYRLVQYSAHYPTLLSLLAAMRRSGGAAPAAPADRIPGFAAALVVELHDDGDGAGSSKKLRLKLRWLPGHSVRTQGDAAAAIAPTDVAVGRPGCGDAATGCSLQNVERAWALGTLGLRQFCDACHNPQDEASNAPAAAICPARVAGDRGCSAGSRFAAGLAGLAIGLLAGVAAGFVYMAWSRRRKSAAMTWGGGGDDDSFEGAVGA